VETISIPLLEQPRLTSAADMETDGCILVGNEYETEDPGPA